MLVLIIVLKRTKGCSSGNSADAIAAVLVVVVVVVVEEEYLFYIRVHDVDRSDGCQRSSGNYF